MTQSEVFMYERIEELERKTTMIKEAFNDLYSLFNKIIDSIEDEQVRRKWGVSTEPEELRTMSEWERLRKYHEYRARVGKSKSSEQWLKEHCRTDELCGEEE